MHEDVKHLIQTETVLKGMDKSSRVSKHQRPEATPPLHRDMRDCFNTSITRFV